MGIFNLRSTVILVIILYFQCVFSTSIGDFANQFHYINAHSTTQDEKSTSELLLELVKQLEKYCGTSSELDRSVCRNALKNLLGNFKDVDQPAESEDDDDESIASKIFEGTESIDEPHQKNRIFQLRSSSEKRKWEMPRYGKRDSELPRSGKRALALPRHGKREMELPRSGKRDFEMPRYGRRELELPRSGKRELPRSGKRGMKLPRSGRREIELPRSGKREIELPRSGKREFKLPRSGKRNFEMPRYGKREMELPRSGKREIELPRSGRRESELPRSGKRELPRSGRRGVADSQGIDGYQPRANVRAVYSSLGSSRRDAVNRYKTYDDTLPRSG